MLLQCLSKNRLSCLNPRAIVFNTTATLALLIATVSLHAEDSAESFHYFKDSVPLHPRANELAFLVPGQFGAAALASIDLPFESARESNHPGWHILTVSRAEPSVRGMLMALPSGPSRPFLSPVFTDDLGGELLITPDLLVAFAPTVPPDQAAELLRSLDGVESLEPGFLGTPGSFRIKTRLADGFLVLDLANSLAARPEVILAEPDVVFSGSGGVQTPNDPGFSNQWGIHNVGQSGGAFDVDMDGPEAWAIDRGDNSIKVVIIDSGIDPIHPDLLQVPGADFTGQGGGGAPVSPCDVHGTAVAGCVSAIWNNAIGVSGIAPDCPSVSARCFIPDASCTSWTSQSSYTVSALNWAVSIGARVTNNSNIYGFTSGAIAFAYQNTKNQGVVHFASAGNNGTSSIAYPSSLTSVNAVMAINRYGNKASFSDYGNGIAFAAPGEDIFTTDISGSGGYVFGNNVWVYGTSFASPYCAGIAALVLSADPSLTALEVEAILQSSAVDLGANGYDTTFGHGLVNAAAALRTTLGCGGLDAFGTGCLGVGGITPKFEAEGCPKAGYSVVLELSEAPPQSIALLVLGSAAAAAPWGGGCFGYTSPILPLFTLPTGGFGFLPGSGGFVLQGAIPASTAAASVTLQFVVESTGSPLGFISTNGIDMSIVP